MTNKPHSCEDSPTDCFIVEECGAGVFEQLDRLNLLEAEVKQLRADREYQQKVVAALQNIAWQLNSIFSAVEFQPKK